MPKGIRNLQISFGETHLTHYGGMFLIQWFCKKLNLKWALQNYVRFSQRNNRYTTGELLLAFMHTIIAGLGRLNSTRILQYNGSFQAIVGLKSFPDATTLRRFIRRLTPQTLHQIIAAHNHIRQQILIRSKIPTNVILDLDSTIITVYGHLEKATIGYNPHRRKRPCYHPILCFEAHTQDYIHGVFRSGDNPSGLERANFLKECLAKLPPQVYHIRVRADASFCIKDFIEFLDGEHIGYAVVARLTQAIQRKLTAVKYHTFCQDWQAGEFRYQPWTWAKPHRFVVVRQPVTEEPTPQLTLFTLHKYAYHVLITNLPLNPESVWRFYKQRARVELNIKELKLDYSLAKIPTKKFLANEIYFHLLLFAYNIVNWFKRLCLPQEFQSITLQTFRTEFLMLPARLVKSGSKNLLRLPARYVYSWVFDYAIKRIQKLELL